MRTIDTWGPWAADLEPGERLARLRSLQALARVLAGPRASDLVALLWQAESETATLAPAADALDRLPSIDMRRIVASYSALARPLPPVRRVEGRATFARPTLRITSLLPGSRLGW